MKKFLIVYYGDAPECVEGFSQTAKRSCKGALHVAPGRKLTVTEDELSHMKEHHKHMLPKLRILSEKSEAKKAEPKKEKKVEAPKVEAEKAHDEGKKKKKRR